MSYAPENLTAEPEVYFTDNTVEPPHLHTLAPSVAQIKDLYQRIAKAIIFSNSATLELARITLGDDGTEVAGQETLNSRRDAVVEYLRAHFPPLISTVSASDCEASQRIQGIPAEAVYIDVRLFNALRLVDRYRMSGVYDKHYQRGQAEILCFFFTVCILRELAHVVYSVFSKKPTKKLSEKVVLAMEHRIFGGEVLGDYKLTWEDPKTIGFKDELGETRYLSIKDEHNPLWLHLEKVDLDTINLCVRTLPVTQVKLLKGFSGPRYAQTSSAPTKLSSSEQSSSALSAEEQLALKFPGMLFSVRGTPDVFYV
ncbi:hypothetical protein VNI00_010174 [Paramarasmius palmivorus]|uniref:Uncharacterized protein n=1 Tax=Paramarasmius palmivorus TaxID=297713 RepID=A0AAW0CJW1_9AGAR